MFGIKINTTDKLFSEIVREIGEWCCVRCGRKHEKSNNTCDTSHYWSRSMKSVRWDFSNADILCKLPCHSGRHQSSLGWEYQKQIGGQNGNKEDGSYTRFKKKQLGEKEFNLLLVRAYTPSRVDEKALRMGFKLMLKRIREDKAKGILGSR